jgi:hypothetical protein
MKMLRIHASKTHKKSSKELKEALGILPEPFFVYSESSMLIEKVF